MQFGRHTPVKVSERQWKFRFDSGFGASVINDGYGADQGLYEVGVLDDDHLTYDTPITNDVLGYLTQEQVIETLDQIEALTRQSVLQAQIDRERQKRDARIAELRAELERLESEAEAVTR